jgi:hypothetical protein
VQLSLAVTPTEAQRLRQPAPGHKAQMPARMRPELTHIRCYQWRGEQVGKWASLTHIRCYQ